MSETDVETERRIKTAEDLASLKTEMTHIHVMMAMQNKVVNDQLEAQRRAMSEQSRIIDAQTTQLKNISELLSQAKGGYKTFMAIGAIGAGIGAFLTTIIGAIWKLWHS